MRDLINKAGLLRLNAFSKPLDDLLAGLIPTSFRQNLLRRVGHLLKLILSIVLDKTNLFLKASAELFQLSVGVFRDLIHLLLPESTILGKLLIGLLAEFCNILLGLFAQPL